MLQVQITEQSIEADTALLVALLPAIGTAIGLIIRDWIARRDRDRKRGLALEHADKYLGLIGASVEACKKSDPDREHLAEVQRWAAVEIERTLEWTRNLLIVNPLQQPERSFWRRITLIYPLGSTLASSSRLAYYLILILGGGWTVSQLYTNRLPEETAVDLTIQTIVVILFFSLIASYFRRLAVRLSERTSHVEE